MALDPSIILQAGRGVTPLLSAADIEQQRGQREMQALQLQQARQGMADDQAYRDVLRSGATGADQITALQRAGLGKQAMDTAKFQTEQQKAQGERGKLVAEGMKDGAGAILANPTEENAIRTLTMAQQQYGLPPQMVDNAKAQIYAARNDPNKLRQLAQGWGGDAEKVLGKFTTENLGGTMQTQRVNPVTGQLDIAASQARTQSPDSVASVAQSAANAQMTDARMREQNALRAQANAQGKIPSGYRLAPDGQTLEFIPGGPADPSTPKGKGNLTEGQSKSLVYAARMQEANAIFDELAQGGKTTATPGSTAPLIGDAITALSGADNQRLVQAKRDFMTAVLRRESGAVISDSEFTNGDKQYFPQIGDSQEVIAQKRRNREIAMRGIAADVPESDKRIGEVRGVPTAAAPVVAKPKPKSPSSKTININGQEMRAELAPDGQYYVQQNGKWSRVKE